MNVKLKLNLQYFAQEKTEQATPKKRKDSRQKGQVAKSTDVNTSFILLFVFLLFWIAGGFVVEGLLRMTEYTLTDYMLMELTEANLHTMLLTYSFEAFLITAPVMLAAAVAGITANLMQVGTLFAPEAIKFKLEKINPLKGFKRIFSTRALVEFLKSMLKISLVGLVTGSVIWFYLDDLLRLGLYSVYDSSALIGNLIVIMGLAVGFLLIFLAMLDYLYQKYDFEKNIRMSKQDVKDEHKKAEGDPLIKSKIKEKQRQMAMNRMMQEVPKADVVITNPTHYAVALKYDDDSMDAPVITAKGVDYIALKIKNTAKNHHVITVENRPLARALYAEADIGDQVPETLFKGVAEVLAYVYRIQKNV
ncbi:flagellar biosynthesis protein FlhB [Alkalicoccus urumqiensis]|uniref:Flagellar biosynthetic protein FlhB n=1 Tax=Alkalicoccus urumqiensis TaxID=1548213 RepID=A0A2P6MG06_ALKUR|nr:flagellar biosynthesis protein FlhB [Alkalicoccus urumqiensis]PRO65214.1 flagellar biosynthesis protein FlhB [Alkalicoccus urumqiensis]